MECPSFYCWALVVINVLSSVRKNRWMDTMEPVRLQFSVLFHDCCVFCIHQIKTMSVLSKRGWKDAGDRVRVIGQKIDVACTALSFGIHGWILYPGLFP